MKTISKFICRILCIMLLFIISNLVIGLVRYGGFSSYISYLDSKNRNESIKMIDLKNPKTILSIFYDTSLRSIDDIDDAAETVISNTGNELSDYITQAENEIENKSIKNNPYDPDYEDDFNSFFGGNAGNILDSDTDTGGDIAQSTGEVGFITD